MKPFGKKNTPGAETGDVLPVEGVTSTDENAPKKEVPADLLDPNNPKYKYLIKNKKARAQIKERKVVIIIAIVLLVLALIGVAIYGFYSAVEINNFSVYVENESSRILSLSDNVDFMPGTQHLEIKGPDFMDNTSLYLCPTGESPIEDKLIDILQNDGQISTRDDKYFASTFYLKNVTTDEQVYNEFFKISEVTQGVDEALRVMVIKNDVATVYAKSKKSGEHEKVVPTTKNIYTPLHIYKDGAGQYEIEHEDTTSAWMAEPFYDAEYVFYNKGFTLKPNEICKYSIIVWLEGWDEECTNDIIGGLLRIDFAFEVAK